MFDETSESRCGRRGWIKVITGSMFTGKTEELIRRLKRARIAMQRVVPGETDLYEPLCRSCYGAVNSRNRGTRRKETGDA